ncbi:MAG: alpha/beta fold hydrolase [Promethearchaeota archaeon]
MKNENAYFNGREQTNLFYQFWLPDSGNIKAYIIGIHDWGTHSDRLSLFADFLTQKGYAIYAFDIRGHWRNAGEYPGHIVSMFDHVQKDIVLFMDVVKEAAGDKKIFIIGEGFGGLIALIYAINHPQLDGVIAASPELELIEKLPASKKVEAKLAPTKTVKYEINQKVLTSDLKILKQHFADKNKIDVISVETQSEIMSAMKWAMKNAQRLSCSCLILQAGEDRIVDKKKSKQFFTKAKSKDKKYIEYDGFYHELFAEKSRAQVYRDTFIWLEKHVK